MKFFVYTFMKNGSCAMRMIEEDSMTLHFDCRVEAISLRAVVEHYFERGCDDIECAGSVYIETDDLNCELYDQWISE